MFATITIELRELFNNLSGVAADALGEDHYLATAEIFAGLASRENLAAKLKGGDTVMLLGDKMAALEECEKKNAAFIVVVTHREKVFGVFNGEDIQW